MPDSLSSTQLIGAISGLLALGVSAMTFIRMATGRGSERQIEPTQIARIEAAIERGNASLISMGREVGELSAVLSRVETDLREMREKQAQDIAAAHRRIDALERVVAAVDARQSVDHHPRRADLRDHP